MNDLVGFIVAFATFKVVPMQIRHQNSPPDGFHHRFQNERILQKHSHLAGKELHFLVLFSMALSCWRSA